MILRNSDQPAVGFGRRPVGQGRVRPPVVVEGDPLSDDAPGLEPVVEFVQIDGFVLKRAPEALDEDV